MRVVLRNAARGQQSSAGEREGQGENGGHEREPGGRGWRGSEGVWRLRGDTRGTRSLRGTRATCGGLRGWVRGVRGVREVWVGSRGVRGFGRGHGGVPPGAQGELSRRVQGWAETCSDGGRVGVLRCWQGRGVGSGNSGYRGHFGVAGFRQGWGAGMLLGYQRADSSECRGADIWSINPCWQSRSAGSSGCRVPGCWQFGVPRCWQFGVSCAGSLGCQPSSPRPHPAQPEPR